MLHAQTRCRSEFVRGFTAGQKIRTGASRAVGHGPLGRGPAFSKTLWLILNVSRESEIYSKGDYFKILHCRF